MLPQPDRDVMHKELCGAIFKDTVADAMAAGARVGARRCQASQQQLRAPS